MFTVKRKHFSDANFNKFLNTRKFFAIFLKKSSLLPPYSLIFATKARGSQRANKPTSQRVEVRRVRQEMGLKGPKGLPGPKTKNPHPHQPQLVDSLTC